MLCTSNNSTKQNQHITAIITGGGTGVRFGADRPKQFLNITGKMLIQHTIQAFNRHPLITDIIVVLPTSEIPTFQDHLDTGNFGSKIRSVVPGGASRQDSVRLGILAIHTKSDYVVIHDAARCLITESEITDTIQKCLEGWKGAICALPVRDTIKKTEGEKIISTQSREHLWGMQTPQVFEYELIKNAYEKAHLEKFIATDDAQIAEYVGAEICVVQGKSTNFKVTYPEDLQMAEMILRERKKREF
jgi:2-C-methyl-D-erythritol 4-phosphate cytidylyltransferase